MSINFYGNLWSPKYNVTKGMEKAARRTVTFANLTLAANTPVDTGLLQRSWKVSAEGRGLHIENPTEYAIFNELGTRKMAPRRMVARSLPLIRAEFERNLAREVGAQLAGEVSESAGNSVGYSALTGQSQVPRANFQRGEGFKRKLLGVRL